MKRLRKLIKGIRSAKGGFSLLELIVVLAIMGFLVAMIAPRLAGVVTGAQRNVDDTNMSRLLQATSQFQERTGRLPAQMTNLVVEIGDPDIYAMPVVSDNNPADGKEAISEELVRYLPLHLHFLSGPEAVELQRLGITQVRNFNPSTLMDPDYDPALPVPVRSSLELVDVSAGTPVLMIGAGRDLGGDWDHRLEAGQRILDPQLAYRIVLGFGQDSELVTAGQLQGAAISPQGTNTDNYVFNNYLLVLPRLAATTVLQPPVLEVRAVNDIQQEEVFGLAERQETHELVVISPEGRIIPPENWEILPL